MKDRGIEKESELGVLPSKTEIRIRKILGIFILLLSPLTILSFFSLEFIVALPIGIYLVAFGIYLLRDKRYHLIVDIFFALIGLFVYFHYIPELRYFLLLSVSSLIPIIEMILVSCSGLFLLFDDILSKNKAFWRSFNRKGLISALALVVFLSGLSLYPMFHKITFPEQSEHAYGIGTDGFSELKMDMDDARYEFNSENNLWVYQINVKNSSDKENAEILKIEAQKLPTGSFSFTLKTILLAPPFDNIKISGGEINGDRIIISPLAETTLVITNPDPLLSIRLCEKEGRIQLEFGSED